MKLCKINKRYVIVDDNGDVVYTPPDFLAKHIQGRAELEALASAIEEEGIDAIVAFEASKHPPR